MQGTKHPVNSATSELLGGGLSVDRQGASLSLLALFHFMSKAQLELWLFGDDVAPASREVITRRTLHGLLDQEMVQRFRFDGRDIWCRRLPKGTGLVNHDLQVVDMVGTFLADARDEGTLTSVETRVDLGSVKPDAYVTFERGKKEWHFFMELEVGTSSAPRFKEKVGRYEELYRSGRWEAVADVWPYILFVSGSEQFERRLLRSVPETKLSLFFTTLPELQEVGPFGKAWKTPGSEKRVVLP